jgi:hypothetical protein
MKTRIIGAGRINGGLARQRAGARPSSASPAAERGQTAAAFDAARMPGPSLSTRLLQASMPRRPGAAATSECSGGCAATIRHIRSLRKEVRSPVFGCPTRRSRDGARLVGGSAGQDDHGILKRHILNHASVWS